MILGREFQREGAGMEKALSPHVRSSSPRCCGSWMQTAVWQALEGKMTSFTSLITSPCSGDLVENQQPRLTDINLKI